MNDAPAEKSKVVGLDGKAVDVAVNQTSEGVFDVLDQIREFCKTHEVVGIGIGAMAKDGEGIHAAHIAEGNNVMPTIGIVQHAVYRLHIRAEEGWHDIVTPQG